MSSPTLFRAYAKVNFYLDVIRKRPDGFHDIETIFQSISLHDTLKFRSNSSEVELISGHPELPPQEENLAYKAAMLLRQETDAHRGASITLEKNVPIGAGLGGGSSDAAATLAALNLLWETNLDEELLLRIGARIGSDVPFCLVGGTAAGFARGEKIVRLPYLSERWLVIVTPPFSVSTRDAYISLDGSSFEESCEGEVTEKFHRVMESVRTGNIEDVLHNAMEPVVLKKHPELDELKRALERAGCVTNLMSGSGPTVFGLVSSPSEGIAAVEKLKRTRPDHFVTLANTSGVGWEQLNTSGTLRCRSGDLSVSGETFL